MCYSPKCDCIRMAQFAGHPGTNGQHAPMVQALEVVLLDQMLGGSDFPFSLHFLL